MRNYIKIAYVRLRIGYWYQGTFQAAFNHDICGIDIDDCSEQIEHLINYYNASATEGGQYVVAESDNVDRYIELNKENVVKILKVASVLNQESEDHLQTWFEGSNQTVSIQDEPINLVDDVFVEESPRETWSHGH